MNEIHLAIFIVCSLNLYKYNLCEVYNGTYITKRRVVSGNEGSHDYGAGADIYGESLFVSAARGG